MSKNKYFDKNEHGKLISAMKSYINSQTYEIEKQKTDNNFAVDTLITETISTLNKKGYKTCSSNSGHIYSYFLRHIMYEEDELINNGDKKYLIVGYHGDLDGYSFPVKYEIISRDSEEFLEYVESYNNISFEDIENFKTDVFRVVFPTIIISVQFIKPYDFSNLPNKFYSKDIAVREFEGRAKDTTKIQEIMCRIDYDFDTFKEEDLKEKINEANKELLTWAKSLPKNEI